MNYTKSDALHKEALEHIVGGVNSPSRSYKAVVGGYPIAMEKGEGAYLYDVDGNRYIDYLAAYGSIITEHAHPHITEAIKQAAETGVLYGTQTAHEVKFAKMIKEAIPSLDKVRFVNFGTEEVMTTISVARAYTGRAKMIKTANPSVDKDRFVNSCTEVEMRTIRVARTYNGTDKIITFAGCYHGHSDLVLVAAGTRPSQHGMPESPRVPQSIAKEVIRV